MDDEGGGQVNITDAGGDAPPSSEPEQAEEVSARRLSMQAAGGVAEDQERAETKPQEEAGSADSEQATTETDGEDGAQLLMTQCFCSSFVLQKVSLLFSSN